MTEVPDEIVEAVRKIFNVLLTDKSDQPTTILTDGGDVLVFPEFRAAFRRVLAEKIEVAMFGCLL
jgi:hypothetical protein